MTVIDLSYNNIIIVNFPAYSGGKFIMNCLSLSRHAVPQEHDIAWYLLEHPDDYDYRLETVMSTLPPTVEEMKNWQTRWEFGDANFYKGHIFNDNMMSWYNGKETPADSLISELINKNMRFFVTTHGSIDVINDALTVWPRAKVISLINSKKFWTVAVNLKNQNGKTAKLQDFAGNLCEDKYQVLRGEDWPDWNLFEQCNYDIDKVAQYVTIKDDIKEEIKQYYRWTRPCNDFFCIDVDNNYFNKENFLNTMKDLYDWAGFDDYNPHLVGQFYDRYIMLHTDTNKGNNHGQTI